MNPLLFHDTLGLPQAKLDEFVTKGWVFVTQFLHQGRHYGGDVIAENWDAAEARCVERGLGETLIGQLVERSDEDASSPLHGR